MSADSRSTLVFVCTGNVCRSPYMEFALRGMLAARGVHDVAIASAGTRALSGHPVDELFAQRLQKRGLDASGFHATALNDELLDRAAIIITAAREHRREVVRFDTALAERTFTLAQLSRLLGSESSGEQHAVAASRAHHPQRLVPPALAARDRRSLAGDADDLEDPWRRSRRVHRRVADRIDDLLAPIAARLAAGV